MLSDINWVLDFRTPALTQFFTLCPHLVGDYFLLGIFAITYWISSRSKPHWLDLGAMIILSSILNRVLKEIFAVARPTVHKLITLSDMSYSFPSGDAQIFTVVSLMIAYYFRSNIALLIAAIMIVIVAVSRVYLGVHCPIDVVCGVIVGYMTFIGYKKYGYGRLGLMITRVNILMQFGLYFLLSCVYYLIMQKHFGRMDVMMLALLAGIWLGYYMLPKQLQYKRVNLIVAILGIIITGAIIYFFKIILKNSVLPKDITTITVFITYFFISFFIVYVLPKIGYSLQRK